VDNLPFEEEPLDDGDVPAFLCSLNDGIEAEIAIAILRGEGIPVMKKRHGAGEYLNIYMGWSNCGVELYVPLELHAKASEILSAEPVAEEDGETIDHSYKQEERKSRKSNRTKIWLTILIFAPGLAGIIGLIDWAYIIIAFIFEGFS
jgi:hypothetical protein